MPAAAVAQAPTQAVDYCFADWPPYSSMRGEDAVGISVDILREASRRSDLQPTFFQQPWNRCLTSVRTGRLDAVIDSGRRPEFLQGPTSFSALTHTFWVRDDDPAKTFTPGFVNRRTVGLVYGYLYPNSLIRLLADNADLVDYATSDRTNIRKLALGRLDTMIGDLLTTTALARENKWQIRPIQPSYDFHRLYPSFNPDRSDLHARIDRALATMLEDGTVDQIYRKYLGKNRDQLGLTEITELNR